MFERRRGLLAFDAAARAARIRRFAGGESRGCGGHRHQRRGSGARRGAAFMAVGRFAAFRTNCARATSSARATSGGVRPSLRARVSFEVLNLLAPQVREQMNDFDLILCRNVLIYLTPAAVEGAVQLFAAALNSGGSLLTGHAELTNRNLGGLVPANLPRIRSFIAKPAQRRTARRRTARRRTA